MIIYCNSKELKSKMSLSSATVDRAGYLMDAFLDKGLFPTKACENTTPCWSGAECWFFHPNDDQLFNMAKTSKRWQQVRWEAMIAYANLNDGKLPDRECNHGDKCYAKNCTFMHPTDPVSDPSKHQSTASNIKQSGEKVKILTVGSTLTGSSNWGGKPNLTEEKSEVPTDDFPELASASSGISTLPEEKQDDSHGTIPTKVALAVLTETQHPAIRTEHVISNSAEKAIKMLRQLVGDMYILAGFDGNSVIECVRGVINVLK